MNADGSDAKEFKEQIPLLLTRGADHQIGYLAPCDAGTQAQLACIEVFGKIDTEPIDGKTKNYEYAKIKAVYSNNYKQNDVRRSSSSKCRARRMLSYGTNCLRL